MSDLDVVHLPGYSLWARRAVVDAWRAAGSPPVRWAGRTYEEQKYLSDGWKKRLPGFNAADDPDLAWTRVPHVRGMALDLRVWDTRTVRRMKAAGFARPIWRRNGFSQDEPWHFELARFVGNVRSVPKVTGAQVAGIDANPIPDPIPLEDEMFRARSEKTGDYLIIGETTATRIKDSTRAAAYSHAAGRKFPVLPSSEVRWLLEDCATRQKTMLGKISDELAEVIADES